MPGDARRTRDSFTEDDFSVTKGNGREEGCEGVYGDEYRTFVRHCAFEEWLPSGGQLKTQNCKRGAKAKTDGQSDLLKKTGVHALLRTVIHAVASR